MRDIKGYEGKYAITEDGRIYSYKLQGFLKPSFDRDGYLIVWLYDKAKKVKAPKGHRPVAEAFIPNPENLPQVKHKDEVHDNNNIDNLEWCSGKYNCNYGTRNQRISEIKRRRASLNV